MAALTDAVREIVMTVLGLDAGNGPQPLQGLRDLGLDSLLALDLKNRLQTATGRRLSPTLAFDYPTIADLAAYLATDVLGIPLPGAAPTPVAQASPDNRDVAALGAMSEDEAEALLIAELSMNSHGERHE
jgi:acyl carrier protein